MKTKADIEKRLRNLRVKYAKKYIAESQSRCYKNCAYNKVHNPTGKYTSSKSVDVTMASRKQVTLVVLNDDAPVHLCMYGSENPGTWLGDVCDSDTISKSCKYFTPLVSPEQARTEFLNSLEDDEFVYDNYRDVATLQWALNDRLFKMHLSWWERTVFWLQKVFLRKEKPSLQLPSGDIPEDIWDDDDSTSST